MKVEEIMTEDVMCLDKDVELVRALEIIKQGYTKIPVVNNGELVGLVTDGEIAKKLGSVRSKAVSVSRMHVSSVMIRDVPTISPETPVEDIIKTVGLPGPTMLPVVKNRKLVGVVTKADLLPLVKSDAPVEWIMSRKVKCVAEDDSLDYARRMMIEHDVQRLPVHMDGKLIGIIAEADIALGYAMFKKNVEPKHQGARIKNLRVVEFMHRNVVFAAPDTTIKNAAQIMLKEGVGCLPIIDNNGKILGIISRTDLVRTIGNEPKAPKPPEVEKISKRLVRSKWQISHRMAGKGK